MLEEANPVARLGLLINHLFKHLGFSETEEFLSRNTQLLIIFCSSLFITNCSKQIPPAVDRLSRGYEYSYDMPSLPTLRHAASNVTFLGSALWLLLSRNKYKRYYKNWYHRHAFLYLTPSVSPNSKSLKETRIVVYGQLVEPAFLLK